MEPLQLTTAAHWLLRPTLRCPARRGPRPSAGAATTIPRLMTEGKVASSTCFPFFISVSQLPVLPVFRLCSLPSISFHFTHWIHFLDNKSFNARNSSQQILPWQNASVHQRHHPGATWGLETSAAHGLCSACTETLHVNSPRKQYPQAATTAEKREGHPHLQR